MKRTFISLLACVIFISFSFPVCSLSQEPNSGYDNMLESLIKRIRSKDSSMGDSETISKTFKALRFAYTETPRYNPYGGIKPEIGPAMWKAFREKDYSKALGLAEKILKENYVDIDSHVVASRAYEKTGNLEEAVYHQGIIGGLIASLLSNGIGETPETAIDVISVDEEYSLLNVSGLRVQLQAEMKGNGHDYDKLTVVDKVSGKTFDMYFCIDKPYRWLQNSFKKSKGQ